jgi:hypothetical protein
VARHQRHPLSTITARHCSHRPSTSSRERLRELRIKHGHGPLSSSQIPTFDELVLDVPGSKASIFMNAARQIGASVPASVR